MKERGSGRRFVVIGATGAIGAPLCRLLLDRGDQVTVLSRDPDAAQRALPGAAAYIAWTPEETGPWAAHLLGADGIVYLAGASIYAGPLSEEALRAEIELRQRGVRGVVRAMEATPRRPTVLVSASSAGTYGYTGLGDEEYNESSPPGSDLWGRLSMHWEEAALEAVALGVRTVLPRPGFVLTAEPGGGLQQQVAQYRAGYGAPVAPGTQWSPWVHIADTVALLALALDDERVRGPLNIVAPGAVRNREFAATLARAVGVPAGPPVPAEALRARMGLTADTIACGRRVVPAAALALGYRFRFPQLDGALRDLVKPAEGAAGAAW